MDDKKGIELVRSGSDPGISITIGSTPIKSQGRPVTVRFEKQMAHVYIVIDTSASMAGNKLAQACVGILDFAGNTFRKGYDVGLIAFSSKARHICAPTGDISVLKDSLDKLHAAGSTNMAEAITMAHDHLSAMKDTRVMVIATDGQPDNDHEAQNAADRAKADKIDIITIGTDDADRSFLKKLASRTELGIKVSVREFQTGISSASNLLPPPKSITRR
jgi:Mg-chelatase subunit ChlD